MLKMVACMSGLLKSRLGKGIITAYPLARRYIPINERIKKKARDKGKETLKAKDDIKLVKPEMETKKKREYDATQEALSLLNSYYNTFSVPNITPFTDLPINQYIKCNPKSIQLLFIVSEYSPYVELNKMELYSIFKECVENKLFIEWLKDAISMFPNMQKGYESIMYFLHCNYRNNFPSWSMEVTLAKLEQVAGSTTNCSILNLLAFIAEYTKIDISNSAILNKAPYSQLLQFKDKDSILNTDPKKLPNGVYGKIIIAYKEYLCGNKENALSILAQNHVKPVCYNKSTIDFNNKSNLEYNLLQKIHTLCHSKDLIGDTDFLTMLSIIRCDTNPESPTTRYKLEVAKSLLDLKMQVDFDYLRTLCAPEKREYICSIAAHFSHDIVVSMDPSVTAVHQHASKLLEYYISKSIKQTEFENAVDNAFTELGNGAKVLSYGGKILNVEWIAKITALRHLDENCNRFISEMSRRFNFFNDVFVSTRTLRNNALYLKMSNSEIYKAATIFDKMRYDDYYASLKNNVFFSAQSQLLARAYTETLNVEQMPIACNNYYASILNRIPYKKISNKFNEPVDTPIFNEQRLKDAINKIVSNSTIYLKTQKFEESITRGHLGAFGKKMHLYLLLHKFSDMLSIKDGI